MSSLDEEERSSGDEQIQNSSFSALSSEAEKSSDLEEMEEKNFIEDDEYELETIESLLQQQSSSSIALIKLPNFLSIQSKPFEPNSYNENEDSFPTLLSPTTTLSSSELKNIRQLKASNVIRCMKRNDQSQSQILDSNAKIVEWSDGSLTLTVGNTGEHFEMQSVKLNEGKIVIYENHTGKSCGIYESQAKPTVRYNIRPFTTESKAHRRFSRLILSKHAKDKKIKIAHTNRDPEKHKIVLEQAEQEKIRLLRKMEMKKKNLLKMEFERSRLTRSYLEDEDSEEGEEIVDEEEEEQRDEALQAAKEDESESEEEILTSRLLMSSGDKK